jgi:methyl-accepting chemotaxis protein
VAGEIRTLAQRCANSAKEISSLLNANVERIEAGVLQIVKASGSMEAIISKAGEVDGVVGTISQDVVNQNQDIQRVRSWLTGLDGMTQQNATLVEEISATSEALKMQTADLSATVAYFNVTQGEPAGSYNQGLALG